MPGDGAIELDEPVAMRRVRFVVAYHGAGFHGFAVNDELPTVAGLLNDALSRISRTQVQLVAAGRTDAGVHGWGQVISCDLPADLDLSNLIHRVNRMYAPAVVLRSGEWASDDFNARYSALWRHYRYTVLNTSVPSPFLTETVWHVHRELSLPAMQLACDPLIGERDFTSFCRKPSLIPGKSEPSLHRRVMIARWSDVTADAGITPTTGRLLRFEIRANAFCHQMVRAIVGTMIDVGHAKLHAGDMRTIMAARTRSVAPSLAPAHGLTLWEVGYPEH